LGQQGRRTERMGTVITLTDKETTILLALVSDEETADYERRALEKTIREQLGVSNHYPEK